MMQGGKWVCESTLEHEGGVGRSSCNTEKIHKQDIPSTFNLTILTIEDRALRVVGYKCDHWLYM